MILISAACTHYMTNFTTLYIGGNRMYGGTHHTIKKIFVHPGYNGTSLENDIGIVQLYCYSTSKTMKMNFDSMTPVAGSEFWTVGYGQLRDGSYPTDLQELLIQSYSNRYCKRQHRLEGFFGDLLVCAGFDTDGFGACFNGWGSPLIIDKNQ
jgi:secreted trypsin-like serine protease